VGKNAQTRINFKQKRRLSAVFSFYQMRIYNEAHLSVIYDQPRFGSTQSLLDGSSDTFTIQPALCEQLLCITMINKLIWQAQLQQWLDDAGRSERLQWRGGARSGRDGAARR
jgi:hypothetical protein